MPILRDRDLILTEEGFFFRVLGYSHPFDGFICDPEYTPASLYDTTTLVDLRQRERGYLKFYGDEGVRFLKENYPKYQIDYKPLNLPLIGVPVSLIVDIKRTDASLISLFSQSQLDILEKATVELVDFFSAESPLSFSDFGIFGSILAKIHHPMFSDIDLAVYGEAEIRKLRLFLADLYESESSSLRNEFVVAVDTFRDKPSPFIHISREELIFHQKRKLIYAIHMNGKERPIKVEFEPIKRWDEIINLYDHLKIKKIGRVKVEARITDDSNSFFMPSEYGLEVLRVISGDADRFSPIKAISYFEQFRMQAIKDEHVLISGVLEKVITPHKEYYQISLSYDDADWIQNVLKVLTPIL